MAKSYRHKVAAYNASAGQGVNRTFFPQYLANFFSEKIQVLTIEQIYYKLTPSGEPKIREISRWQQRPQLRCNYASPLGQKHAPRLHIHAA